MINRENYIKKYCYLILMLFGGILWLCFSKGSEDSVIQFILLTFGLPLAYAVVLYTYRGVKWEIKKDIKKEIKEEQRGLWK